MNRQFTWTDRRPIGKLNLTQMNLVKTSNPNGWLFELYPGATFAERIQAYVDRAIEVMKKLNGQGMIVWDIEGAAQPQYLGSPDDVSLTGEHWQAGFFKQFRDAGFKVGCCLRPIIWDGNLVTAPEDHALSMYRKAAFAREKWQCKLFYVDSPFLAMGDKLLPVDLFKLLHKALPDCLFIPEHGNLDYPLWTAQYREVRNPAIGSTPTIAQVAAVVPDAFSVINCSVDDPATLLKSADYLRGLFRAGQVALLDAWWYNPCVDPLLSILSA